LPAPLVSNSVQVVAVESFARIGSGLILPSGNGARPTDDESRDYEYCGPEDIQAPVANALNPSSGAQLVEASFRLGLARAFTNFTVP
jgi:hypothetical protein